MKIINLKPEHIPMVEVYLEELDKKYFPAMEQADTKDAWRLAMNAHLTRGERFWEELAVFYPETKKMACGLGRDELNRPFIIIQGPLEKMVARLKESGMPAELKGSCIAQTFLKKKKYLD